MKHIQPKTMLVMVEVLSTGAFTQRMIWRRCNRNGKVSIGQVNKVVNDLKRKGFVGELYRRKRLTEFKNLPVVKNAMEDFDKKNATYRLSDPMGLLEYISLFRFMSELHEFTIKVDATEEEVAKELSRKNAVFCLGTAQQHYTSYFRPDAISFYSDDPREIYDYLGTAKRGRTALSCYRIDFLREEKHDDIRITSKVQTVIDMFCDKKSAYTKPLLKELWGLEI